jgi:hypothetical protein
MGEVPIQRRLAFKEMVGQGLSPCFPHSLEFFLAYV